jgi:hypothetical protein
VYLSLSLNIPLSISSLSLYLSNDNFLFFPRGPIILGAAGLMVGGIFGSYSKGKSLKKKSDKEKKDLIQYIQLQEEIYKQREQVRVRDYWG